MKTNRKALKSRTGFTIVELLTVMGVIAILIGLLVPALTLVRDFSKEIQQKAQFHSIDVGLEMYKTEFGEYPESIDNQSPLNPPADVVIIGGDPSSYGGANKLAEAMVGLDMLGYHPKSLFRSDGLNVRDEADPGDPPDLVEYDVYHANVNDPGYETALENVQNRKGPLLDSENANAFKMEDVYEDLAPDAGGDEFDIESFVLCDMYAKKRAHSGKKTGMPILYYRARTAYTDQDYTQTNVVTQTEGIEDDIYFYPDNENLLSLGLPEDSTIDHPLNDDVDDYEDFEEMILNPEITAINRPYRASSFILISAGKDGYYGTPDDLFNFDKE